MKDLVKTLFGLGVTVGLSDRDTFVGQVSGLIQQYQDDPQKAEKWANAAVAYMENMRDRINLQTAIKDATEGSMSANAQQVEDLTSAIKELTAQLQQKKKD